MATHNNLLLRAVNDKVHIPMAPRAAAEQGRQAAGEPTMLDFVLLVFAAQAVAVEPTPEPFMSVFTATCLQNYFDPDRLVRQLNEGGAELTAAEAVPFLRGRVGRAWALAYQGKRYAVALTDGRICAAYAQEVASPEGLHAQFRKTLSSAAPPYEVKVLPVGPNSGLQKTASFAWVRPGAGTQLQFTLTTSSDSFAQIKAMASMAETSSVEP